MIFVEEGIEEEGIEETCIICNCKFKTNAYESCNSFTQLFTKCPECVELELLDEIFN